jgi:hypothetical protein
MRLVFGIVIVKRNGITPFSQAERDGAADPLRAAGDEGGGYGIGSIRHDGNLHDKTEAIKIIVILACPEDSKTFHNPRRVC